MAIKRVCDLDEIVLDSTTQRLQGEDLIEITQFQDEDRYISKKIKYDTLLSSIVKGVADRLSAVTDRMIRTTPPASAVPIGAIFYMTQRYDTVLSGSSGYDISACVNEDGELVGTQFFEADQALAEGAKEVEIEDGWRIPTETRMLVFRLGDGSEGSTEENTETTSE